jgi:hypothetical protein
MRNVEAFAAANVRSLKSRSGSIGSAVIDSQIRNSASSTAPATNENTTSPLDQPSSWLRTTPQTTPNEPAAASARPRRSSDDVPPYDSSSLRMASGTSTRPTGTLTQKIQCHEMPSTIAPPTTGPSATARPATPPQMPSAAARFSFGNAFAITVSVSGITIAPPTPCAARATTSAVAVGASAAAAEATVKSVRPIESIRRRPKRSPSAAPVSRSTAKVSVYALTVHSRLWSEAFRSWRITGSAVDTTRLSRVTMKTAADAIPSAHPDLFLECMFGTSRFRMSL